MSASGRDARPAPRLAAGDGAGWVEELAHFPNVVGRDGGVYLSCAEVISFLFEYLADEIGPARRAEFERHLARCTSCRDYLATYRTTILLARGAFDRQEPAIRELPAELVEVVLAARG